MRKDLQELRRQVYCDVNDRQEIMKEIAIKEKQSKSAETTSPNVISADLEEELIAELLQSSAHSKNASRGFVEKVTTAEFQADALIMGRSINRDSLLKNSPKKDA